MSKRPLIFLLSSAVQEFLYRSAQRNARDLYIMKNVPYLTLSWYRSHEYLAPLTFPSYPSSWCRLSGLTPSSLG